MAELAHPAFFNFGGDVVDRWAREADRPALIWTSAEGAEERYLFSDIARLSACLASALAARGITKGDRVLVMLPRIPQWQITMVACLKLGVIPIPCIEMLSAKDIAYRIAASGATAAIARGCQADKFEESADRLAVRIAVGEAPGWEDFAALITAGDPGFLPVPMAAEDPAILYFTSGSSGQPKGVLHAARGLYHWRMSAIEWLDLGRDDIMWCTADTGWSKAGTSILFGPWSCGCCVFFHDGPFDPAERLRLLARHAVTVYCASGTELLRVLDVAPARIALPHLRRTVSAGEMVSAVAAERWRDRVGHDIAEAYGLTEALMLIGNRRDAEIRRGSAGRPLADNDVAIIDAAGRVLPPGEAGEVALRAPNPQLMLGYWQDPERTAACYIDGPDGRWFRTGDLGHRDARGHVFLEGRNDDLINSAGYRIGPSEIEDILLADPGVAEAAVVGSPDAARGEIVVAFVVTKPGYKGETAFAQALQASVKAATAPYKYPRRIYFLPDLPKTPTGKIRRNILRQWAIEKMTDHASVVAREEREQ